jgi:hypothetical protein
MIDRNVPTIPAARIESNNGITTKNPMTPAAPSESISCKESTTKATMKKAVRAPPTQEKHP